jgi:hypothetical protein
MPHKHTARYCAPRDSAGRKSRSARIASDSATRSSFGAERRFQIAKRQGRQQRGVIVCRSRPGQVCWTGTFRRGVTIAG